MRSVFTLVFLIACGSSQPAPVQGAAPGQGYAPGQEYAPGPDPAPPATLTPEQCTKQGGEIRGDIGDGRIACAKGERELGRVPLGIEGSICCAPATH